MHIGVFLPTMTRRDAVPRQVVPAARHAEQLGFESVWAIDQLIAGTGVPIVDSTVALAAAAGATSTITLGYGVLILPLRPVVWTAKQVASLQLVSDGRLVFGVGVGGDRHDLSWRAAGVPRDERGARTDAALAVLPDLIAGKPVDLDGHVVELAPGTPVPPVLVGGAAEAALARTVAHGDGWFGLPLPPPHVATIVERLGELAARAGREVPSVTGSVMVSLTDDPDAPDDATLDHLLTDPDGLFGIPAAAPGIVIRSADALVQRLGEWDELGAERSVITIAAGDWMRQTELIASAVR